MDGTRDFKLIEDPFLTRVSEPVYRYGVLPTEKRLLDMVDPRPRMARLGFKKAIIELKVPEFVVDQNYMLPLRPKQVTFSNLNNNVNLSFLTSMCSPYGPIHYHHIYYHPVSKAHLGLATVVFEKSSSAQKCVEKLHKTPCMGNIMNVVLDEKGLEKERTYRELLTDTKRSEFHPVSLQACNENADKNIIKVPTVTNGISSQPLPRLGHSTSFHNTHKNTPNISSENSFASYRRKSANESSNSFTTYNSYSQYKNSTKYNELYNCAKNNGFKNDSGYDYNKNKMAKSEKERGRFGREDSRRWLEKGGKDRWNEKIDGGNDRRMKDRGWRDMNNDKKDRNHRDEKRYSKSDKRRHKNDYPRKHRDSYDRDSFDGRSRDGRRRDDRKDGDDVTKNSFFPSRVSSKTSTETVEVTNDVASSSSRHRLSSSSSHKEDAHESLESRIQALLSQFIPQPPPSPTDPPHLLSPFSSPQIVVTSSSSVYLNHKHFSPFYSHPTTPLDTPFTPTYQSTTSFNNTPTTPISFYQKVPPPNLAQTITVQNPEPSSTDTYTHADQHKDEITHEKRRAKNNKSLEENYHDVTKELSIQIKEVLRKDIKKRLTEMHAFPIYEQWWSSKNENNMSLSSLSIGKTLSHSNISAPAAPIANPLSTILERQGGILGLKGSTWLSSLPSFKKKSGPPRQDFHARSWDDRRTKNKKIDKKGINDRNIENERRSVNDRRMNECEDEEDEEEWRKNKKKTFKGPRTPEASDAEDGVRDRMGKRESRDDVGRHAKNKSKTFSNVTKNSEKNKKSLSKKDNEKMINKNKLNEKNKENIKIDHKKAIKNRSLPFVYSSPSSQSSLSSDSEVSIGDYQEETGMCKNNNNKYLLSKNNFSADDDDDDDDDVSDVDVIGLVKPSTKLGNIYTTDEDSDVDVDDKRRLSSSLSSSSSGLSSDAEVNKAKETKPVISETKGVKNGGQKAKKDNDFEDYVSKKHKAMVKQKKQKPADKKEVKKHRYNSINDDDDDFVAGNAYKRQRKNSYKSKTTKKISDKSNVRINNDIDEDNSVDVDDSKSLVEQKSKQINTKNSPLSNNDYYIDYLELLSSVASSLSHKKVDSGLEPATNDLKQEPANHSTDGGMKVDNKGRKDVGMVESKEVLHRVKLIEMDHKYPLHHSLEVKSKKGRRPKKRFSSLPHDSYDSSGCETVGIDDGGAEEVGGGEVMRVASVDACVNETDKVRLVASNLYCEHSYCFSIAHFFLNSDELKRSKVVCDDVYDNYSTPDEVFVNGVSYVEKDMGGGGMVKGVVDVNGGRFVREYVPNIACEFDVEMKETTKNVEDEDEEEEGEYHSSEKEMKIEKFEELKKKKRKLSVTDDIPKNKKSKLQRSSNTSKASRELANLLPGAVAAVATKAPKFKKRDFTAETKVLYKIVTECIDLEDAMYLERQFKAMIEDSEAPAWVRMTRWGEYSISKQAGFPIISPKKKTRRRDVVEFHKTGSCRTEGYYKVSHQTKRYLRSIQGTELHSDNNEDNTTSNNHVQLLTPKSSSASNLASTEASLELVLKKRAQQTRQARMEGRRLQTLISFNLEPTDLLKFNQLKLRKKHLKFTRSRIHDWGLFAMEPISEGEFVIEYVGETVRQSVADLRERRYEKEGLGGSSYLFRIDANNIVDATKMGNLARFINHSCNPNCCARIVSVDGTSRIVIYSRREIEVNEEITYDYKFPYEDDKIPCLCGAQGCRGTLN